jgi:23S rRNA pseudouridine1911/1915/1917 synthase
LKLNHGHVYRERIEPTDAGLPLLDYLARRHRHSSASRWRQRIEIGLVRIGGMRVEPGHRLRTGETVVWHRPPWQEPPAPRCFAVLFEDADLLAVAKPAGLPCLPGGGFLEHTLLAAVRDYAPGAVPAHRLGRWTSGLVIFAKSPQARSGLAAGLRRCAWIKRYRALASGLPRRRSFEITQPIGRIPYAATGDLHAASASGKPASSAVRVIEPREGNFLAEVRIRTGRPHQVRIHLASAGHPLLGDPLYGVGGVPAPGCTALPGDPGYRLHALSVELRHPRSAAPLRLECAAPAELRAKLTP